MIERILGGPLELGLFCIKSISSFVSRISFVEACYARGVFYGCGVWLGFGRALLKPPNLEYCIAAFAGALLSDALSVQCRTNTPQDKDSIEKWV